MRSSYLYSIYLTLPSADARVGKLYTFLIELFLKRTRTLEIQERGKRGSEVVQTITIITGGQERRPLLDSQHLGHEKVGYSGQRGER